MNWDQLVEGIAVITGILCVWLNIRQNIWTWPTAIISSLIFGIVFFEARLYTTMLLQGLFIGISFYGWKAWATGGAEGGTLRVSRLRIRTSVLLLILTLVGTAGFAFILHYVTASDHPILEGLTTTLSIVASGMATRKILEHWMVWIFVDALYVFLYFATGLYLTLLLYALYLGLAANGYFSWRQSYRSYLSTQAEVSDRVHT